MITYAQLENKYTTMAPTGFREFTAKHGINNPNTCAVRVSYALFECDKDFFKNVQAQSGIEWYGLPTRAADLAIIFNTKFRPATLVDSADDISGKNIKQGIIFFDTITGFGGTGHISLWNGAKVVDDGDYFGESPRTYFWQLV